MTSDDLLERIATRPVEGDAPGGPSLRYDESFAAIEAEIAKLEQPAGAAVDWAQVETGCAALLAERSKDLLLAVWMTRAMWQQRGLAGLAVGLRATRRMLDRFWDGAHPQRIRARQAALAWLADHLAVALDATATAAGEAAIPGCRQELEALRDLWPQHAAGEDCGLGVLLPRLQDVRPASVANAPASAPERVPVGGIASRAQAVAALGELAAWWARHEPASPMVPLLNRAVAWSVADFPTVFGQLLRSRTDAREHLWDVLGITDPPQG